MLNPRLTSTVWTLIRVPSTSVSNEDSGESEDSGDAKALKTSPTIMKKLTSEKSPSTNDDDSKVVNCGLSVEKEE